MLTLAACAQQPIAERTVFDPVTGEHVHVAEYARLPGTPGDAADATSTAAVLGAGLVEANPLYAPCGAAAPACVYAGRLAAQEVAIAAGADPVEVKAVFNQTGWIVAAWNIGMLAAPPVAAIAAVAMTGHFIGDHEHD